MRPNLYYRTQQVLSATPDLSPELRAEYNAVFYNKFHHLLATASQMGDEKAAAVGACALGTPETNWKEATDDGLFAIFTDPAD